MFGSLLSKSLRKIHYLDTPAITRSRRELTQYNGFVNRSKITVVLNGEDLVTIRFIIGLTLQNKDSDIMNAIIVRLMDMDIVGLSKADIKKVIEDLSQEIEHASPDTLRMVFNNLFREIKVGPKTKNRNTLKADC